MSKKTLQTQEETRQPISDPIVDIPALHLSKDTLQQTFYICFWQLIATRYQFDMMHFPQMAGSDEGGINTYLS